MLLEGYRGYRQGSHGDPEALVVEGSNITVCMATDTFEKMPMPVWLRARLAAYQTKLAAEEA